MVQAPRPRSSARSLSHADRAKVRALQARLAAAWPAPSLLPQLAFSFDGLFPKDERSIAYTRTADGALGAVGQSVAPDASSWRRVGGANAIREVAIYPLRRRERWASVPVIETELAPTREWLHEMRTRVLAPNDAWHQLRVTLYDRNRYLGMYAALRSRDAGPFGEREKAMLRLLVPSLRRVFYVESLLRETQLRDRAVQSVLDALPEPSFLITRGGAVVHANPAARARHPSPPRWLRHAAHAPHARAGVSAHPVRVDGIPLHLVQERSVAVGDPAGALDLSRLSPREAEIARLACEGFSVLNVAARLGVAESTIRTHLKHIYRKFGVHSRAELAYRALGRRA